MEERDKAEIEAQKLEKDLAEKIQQKERLTDQFQEQAIQDYLEEYFADFDKKSDHQKKRIVQSVIAAVILHPNNKLEIKINPDPRGSRAPAPPTLLSGCHIEANSSCTGRMAGCTKLDTRKKQSTTIELKRHLNH